MRKSDDPIFSALLLRKSQNAASQVFKTPNHDVFITVCKEAYRQRIAGEPVFTWLNEEGRPEIFPFTAFVLTMPAKQKAEIHEQMLNVWRQATYPKGIAENIELTQGCDKVPLAIEGADEKSIEAVAKRLAEIDRDLRSIVENQDPTTVDLYSHFQRVGTNHSPTHPHTVMNETWLQDHGTVITDEDENICYQAREGERLFMPPSTYHRPPLIGLDRIDPNCGRFSLISNACTYG